MTDGRWETERKVSRGTFENVRKISSEKLFSKVLTDSTSSTKPRDLGHRIQRSQCQDSNPFYSDRKRILFHFDSKAVEESEFLRTRDVFRTEIVRSKFTAPSFQPFDFSFGILEQQMCQNQGNEMLKHLSESERERMCVCACVEGERDR